MERGRKRYERSGNADGKNREAENQNTAESAEGIAGNRRGDGDVYGRRNGSDRLSMVL